MISYILHDWSRCYHGCLSHSATVYSDDPSLIIEGFLRMGYADSFAEFWAYKVQSSTFIGQNILNSALPITIGSAGFAKRKSWNSSPTVRDG